MSSFGVKMSSLLEEGIPGYGDWKMEPSKTALVIIDTQNKFMDLNSGSLKSIGKAYGMNCPEAPYSSVRKNIRRLLDIFREYGLNVVHVVVGCWSEDMRELEPHLQRFWYTAEKRSGIKTNYQFGTWESEIIDELKPIPGEVIIQKTTSSAFTSTDIDRILKAKSIEYLLMAGGATDGCVFWTTQCAFDHGYYPTLALDACYPYIKREEAVNKYGLTAKIWTTEEIISEIKKKGKTAK